MIKLIIAITFIFLFEKCNVCSNKPIKIRSVTSKARPIGISRWAPFIRVELRVYPYTQDSIIVQTDITNNDSEGFCFYKPLLPFDGSYAADFWGIMEKNSYAQVEYTGCYQGKYLQYPDGSSNYLIPELNPDKFIFLKPGQTLHARANIAPVYDFNKYMSKGLNQFKITYGASFPFVKDNKQVTELDSVDNKIKPVYYIVSVDEKEDPDSMRVDFTIPILIKK